MAQQVYNQPQFAFVTGVNMNAAASTLIFTPVCPIDIYRWGFIALDSIDVTAGEVALDHRPTATSEVGRVQVQSMVFGAAQDLVEGEMYFANIELPVAEAAGEDTLSGGVTAQTSRVNVGPTGPFRADPGSDLMIEIVGAFDGAGNGHFFIEFWALPLSNMADKSRLNFKGNSDPASL